VTLANLSDIGQFDKAVEMGLLSCVECGSCSYVCPAHRFLLQSIQLAKQEVEAKSYKKTS
jgi:electron transport complex protein RnfC